MTTVGNITVLTLHALNDLPAPHACGWRNDECGSSAPVIFLRMQPQEAGPRRKIVQKS